MIFDILWDPTVTDEELLRLYRLRLIARGVDVEYAAVMTDEVRVMMKAGMTEMPESFYEAYESYRRAQQRA